LVKAGLARRLADDSGPAVDWLQDLGVNFYDDVMQGGGERVARSHVPNGRDVPGGQHVIDVLLAACKAAGVEVALGNRVQRLLVQNDTVVGVVTGDGQETEASAVVLATGGFGANDELIKKHLPSLAHYGELVFYVGPQGSRGDAFAMGEQVGASVVGHDVYVPLLSPKLDTREYGSYMPGWMLLLGPDGRRIGDETAPYGQTYGMVRAVGDVAYGIFDARTLADNGTDRLDTFKPKFPEGMGGPPNIWTKDAVERYVNSSAMLQSESVEHLVRGLGLPEKAAMGAISRYNTIARAGFDRDFGKPSRFLRTIEHPPFYGVEIRPSTLGITACGLEIDSDGRVLTAESTAVPGLYAAGEVTGGVLGTRYLGSGNAWASCLVFGRAAGQAAADYALDTTEQATRRAEV
jgi:fumarate reductase flavoprotein subunit